MYSDATGGVQACAPDFDKMPAELKAFPNWVCWKLELRDDSPTKVPYCAYTGQKASVTDNTTLATFEVAQAAFYAGGYTGVGFVFGPNDPFAGIDLDDSDDDAVVKKRQDSIFDAFQSYAELSPSGRGLHIIVKGSVSHGRRRDCVEVYSNERFFTMTGHVYRDVAIKDHHDLLNALWHEIGGSTVKFDAQPYFRQATESDEAVFNKLAGQWNGDKFVRLWNADISAVEGNNKSSSEVDLALVNMLAWRTKDPAQIERMWLMCPQGQRDKTQNRPKYRYETIVRAFDRELPAADTSAVFQPQQASGMAREPAFRRGISAAALLERQFNPVRYVVPGYIAEGVTLLAGAPKMGKSWMAMGLCVSVATGEPALGSLYVEQGDVLYLALEDNERRLKKRLLHMGLKSPPHRLTLVTQWPDMDNGCAAELDLWIASVPRPTLIVVDVLNKVRAVSTGRQPQYEADYRALTGLHAVAAEHGIAIVVLHHTRKMEADDPFDLVSGTRGLTGAADSVLVLGKDKGVQHSVIYGRGRDIEEIETAVQFERDTGRWTILGNVYSVAKTSERQVILDALSAAGKAMSPSEVAAVVGKERSNVNHLLGRMVEEGKVSKAGSGLYTPFTPFTPVTATE